MGQQSFLERVQRNGRAFFFAASALCLGAIAVLAVEIVRDLRLLNTANSDNVQWTLSQAEVEFLEFQHAVDQAQGRDDAALLEEVVVEFDILYSRLDTLASGALYAALRSDPDFRQPLDNVQDALRDLIPLIDGPRPELQQRLDDIEARLEEIRPSVRRLSNSGLYHFARLSDDQRSNIAVTLTRLAVVTLLLVLALVFLLRHAQRANRMRERRGAELSAAYTRLNTILDTSLDGVVVADMDGNIQQFNPSAERIFKYDFQDVIGKNIGDMIVPPHLRDAHNTGMARMHKTGERRVVGHGRVRLEAMRSDGEVFPVELALESAHSGEEEIVIAFLRDISHRVAAENELVDARDKALAGEKAKAEFLAMMTHEIRTPLNGVLGNLSLMEETRLSPTQARYVRNMGISGNLLMSHVDAVLDVARFEAGVTTSSIEDVHIGRLVQDIVASQLSAAEAAGNQLEWGWTGDPVTWASLDASRLQQVVLNLLGNAIKFTHRGRIKIELEEVPLDTIQSDEAFEAGERATGVEIRVIDTGVGISEDDLDRVFEDFHTGVSPLEPSVPGTGLGLGIARRFVQAMGGEIGVESTLEEGSVFWLRVPVNIIDKPDEDSADAPVRTAVSAERKILLVEDNEINLQLARDMLEGLGHKVTVARDGRAGLQAANAERFDLILMDIRMPVMDGLTATREIRDGQGASRAVPIVALSANVLPEARNRFLASGMSAFLGKPLIKAELVQIIDTYCTDDAGTDAEVETAEGAKTDAPAAEDPFAALMTRYVEEAEELFDWLEAGPEDMTEVVDRVHRIAGSAAAFGQLDLRMALLRVEEAAESGDADALRSRIAEARLAWREAPAPSLA